MRVDVLCQKRYQQMHGMAQRDNALVEAAREFLLFMSILSYDTVE